MATQIEDISYTFCSRLVHHEERELLKYAVVSVLICCGESGFTNHFSAKPKVIAF